MNEAMLRERALFFIALIQELVNTRQMQLQHASMLMTILRVCVSAALTPTRPSDKGEGKNVNRQLQFHNNLSYKRGPRKTQQTAS